MANEGASTQFVCKEPPNARQPDRFEWLRKSPTEEEQSELSPHAVVSPDGSILELNNVTESSAGWFYCCLFYSPVSSLARSELIFQDSEQAEDANKNAEFVKYCSSGQLEVQSLSNSDKKRFRMSHVFLIVACVCLILTSMLAVLVYCCFMKLRVIINAQKAVSSLKEVINL